MPKIENKKEIISFQGLVVSDFLDKKFLKKLGKIGKEIDSINLLFMVKEEKGKMYPIVLGHSNNQELAAKIINIDAPPEMSKKLIKILEEME